MREEKILRFSERLSNEERTEVWREFLESYSSIILQMLRLFEQNEDHVADAYVFVCERLSQDGFRRLRRFPSGGGVSFRSWLRAVVHNLYLDWRRREHGRRRPPAVVARLPVLDQEVFRCLYEEKKTLAETHASLQPLHPELTLERMTESAELLGRLLSSQQRWRLQTRAPRVVPLNRPSVDGTGEMEIAIPSGAPSPEATASLREERAALRRALDRLDGGERLLVRLRFQEGLPLREVARLTGLENAQSADRAIRKVLALLRERLG